MSKYKVIGNLKCIQCNNEMIEEQKTDDPEIMWLFSNAHKYGFILRYPEDKEEITGYKFESWHYRYLGVDLATKVYNEGITFDEYYEFYLNN